MAEVGLENYVFSWGSPFISLEMVTPIGKVLMSSVNDKKCELKWPGHKPWLQGKEKAFLVSASEHKMQNHLCYQSVSSPLFYSAFLKTTLAWSVVTIQVWVSRARSQEHWKWAILQTLSEATENQYHKSGFFLVCRGDNFHKNSLTWVRMLSSCISHLRL